MEVAAPAVGVSADVDVDMQAKKSKKTLFGGLFKKPTTLEAEVRHKIKLQALNSVGQGKPHE